MNGWQIFVRTTIGRGSEHGRRVMGLLGIVGGALLLAAFLIPIPLNSVRLVTFNAGVIAVAVGVYQRYPRVALVGTGPIVAANVWYAVMVLLSLGVEHPFAGDFGLFFFLAAVAMWLADAWFGAVVLAIGRSDRIARFAGFALLVGSLLAFTGVDRLGLTGQEYEMVFTPLSLAGIFLNGCGWILLGGRLMGGPRRG